MDFSPWLDELQDWWYNEMQMQFKGKINSKDIQVAWEDVRRIKFSDKDNKNQKQTEVGHKRYSYQHNVQGKVYLWNSTCS